MKEGNWIALHKELKFFLPHGRPYSMLEAMFSYTLDMDNKREGTISGYSKLWGWSRTKVRKFIEEIKTVEGHLTNRQSTGKRHQILLKLNNLRDQKDKTRTVKRHLKDSQVDTTINPNTNTKPNIKIYGEFQNVKLSKDEHKKLTDKFNGTLTDKIETLSEYMKSKGRTYKSHYATILSWARRDDKQSGKNKVSQKVTDKDYSEGISEDGRF